MIQSNDLRAGMSIIYEDNLYQVLDTSHNKTAQRQMIIKAKVRNMRSGSVTELTMIGGDKVEQAHIDKRVMQYLYDAGEELVFMDGETYEQLEIAKSRLEWEMNFMKENQDITVVFYESEVLGVNLPEKIALTVTQAEPAVKGDTATNAQKNAVVETGLEIRVPLFISEGEVVLVNTTDGKYSGRA
ncbi:elongation factor P [Erysipelothrix rhusiopathiae]|uniref:Elongation factor P n=2 Tax=Erysipelothrix TaxID=1647 RepID=E7FU96_ERYRH|nr:elongation factor P [Erysipelothrix rhusiopathiae]CAH2762653.1 elongation factor P [Erysipelothrix sp. A18Y020d]AMS11059.1 elongation factor P [Erysipelothrix rhusiopathiae]AOO67557.1 elongation factor P [Erysipelothrix rhusiopathiae]AWU41580.1 elongation factor P [Erysipelothrix rhusiopathiae]AYV34535.1 elongation factor P [Erysipelothrix rhusiopathiae]